MIFGIWVKMGLFKIGNPFLKFFYFSLDPLNFL